jgi:signal transduction histidine kinase
MFIFLGAENILYFFVKPRIDFDSYDGLLHAEELFHLIGLFMILATLLSSRQRKDRPIRLLLLSGLPVVIWETVIQLPLSVWGYLEEHYAIEKPPFIRVLDKNYETVNGMLMAWLALVFCWMLFQRFLNLQKETARQALEKERIQKEKETELREFIEQQNIELEKKVELRTSALKQTLEDLKATQMQLIQSEKMASLGELTAGIAHEIQNPLNFVNNFSEVNKELADELTSELATGNTQLANDIAGDIKINSDKINFHGRRADSIVKSMLQHSRTGSGVKELTDLNALADEHLRLAYHGFRAKEKGFNTKLETNFDSSIGKIAIIPQEIGRVLLNLFNNALYAVTEKQKLQQANFEPTVAVRTQKINGGVEIRVQDNGTGIPIDMVGRIFQPFFTSKPTGQGTGLGLSLAYDIVKAHGGEIKVETKEGEGSCFFIVLSQ